MIDDDGKLTFGGKLWFLFLANVYGAVVAGLFWLGSKIRWADGVNAMWEDPGAGDIAAHFLVWAVIFLVVTLVWCMFNWNGDD